MSHRLFYNLAHTNTHIPQAINILNNMCAFSIGYCLAAMTADEKIAFALRKSPHAVVVSLNVHCSPAHFF